MTTENPARQKSGLVLFLAVTFATAWASWGVAIALGQPAMSFPTVIPYLLGAFGPMIGAIAVRVRRAARRQPAPEHTVRFPLTGLLWLPVLLVVAAGTVVGGALLGQQLGGPVVSLPAALTLLEMSGGPIAFAAVMLVVGPLSEEFGWRGTMHPRLRAKMGRLLAGLLLGVVWSVWHLPLFFVAGTVQNAFGLFSFSGLTYLVSVIPMAVLAAYGYERAGVLGAVIVHFGTNATMSLVGISELLPQALVVGVQAVVALVLLAVHREKRSAAPEPVQPQPVPALR
ncbi:CPBP family intramembrane glutamic endopeptidase [Saccharopolyspora sp. NPDC000359]|uniref:CPBP family intramembrane glutamic endopeptidase n=1 Tax=Saccharopolyspora sp. NPDC000359 TaxID=3154251 RepID=UPI003320B603